jgi:adenine phosphoribosyltransferase
LIEIEKGTWIASNAALILGDVAFIGTAARLLSDRLRPAKIELLVTAEAKCIALAYALSKELGLQRFVVARKSPKAYMKEYTVERVRSITTRTHQQLLLSSDEALALRNNRVCLLDDVVSTGATLRALETLVSRAGATVASKAVIWKEGPWYRAPDLTYLGRLPIFVRKGAGTTVPL